MTRLICLWALLCPALALSAAPQTPFELHDGDRVVFIGDTLIEREKDFGYIELMMTLRFPDRNITFRNLGWSADTPDGISRVSFDWPKGPAESFRQLMEQIKQVQPTVVVLGYGMASSFDGEAGIERFSTSYNHLIDAILDLDKNVRFILLSPIPHEKLPPPLNVADAHNPTLATYSQAIHAIAEKRSLPFVDLAKAFSYENQVAVAPEAHWATRPFYFTDNGIHLNKHGYAAAALVIGKELGWQGVSVMGHEDLREVTIKKNQLFFHRWRPENTTYLFLFRKHEQGKNAQEIPQFDPLVHAEEEKIAQLRRQPAQTDLPQAIVHKPKQIPVTEHPATPVRPQPIPTFELADPNLEVTLWAEDPQLAKPIAINWDARGRLWVASSSVYPQIIPGQEQEDKILVLEDTDNDGKADKTTVFADGLLIPTGVEPGDGGCYVGQSTELLHFKDTDGDGIADERRVVLSGFGTEDTHHILHTLRWGPDGRLYMNQSIYIHSHIETPNGVVRLNSGGTLALRPDTLELGVTMKGLINGWGHDWDEFGQEFQTDGAGGNGINWNIPQAMFVTYEGARRTLGSISPGSYPKFCGLELIRSERFPKEWQGNAITCDFRANRMVRFEIIAQGGGYTTKQHEFLRSTNITFRPIDVKLGPDGALYIADWSNPIIQHGEVDFRDPRRDRVHGRIWRVAYKGGKNVARPDLVNVSANQLLDDLFSPNAYVERQARRVLVSRYHGNTNESQIIRRDLGLLGRGMLDGKRDGRALLEVLWVYQCFDLYGDQTAGRMITELLSDTEPRLRAATIRILGAWSGNTPGLRTLRSPRLFGWPSSPGANWLFDVFSRGIQDNDPRVRNEALRALARIPSARSAELALGVLDKGPVDGFLEYALWLTINDLADPWVAAVKSGEWNPKGHEQQLQYALRAIEPGLASGVMARVIGNEPLPRDGSGGMIELIGQAGGPPQLRHIFDQVLSGGFTDEACIRALNWLAEAARLRSAKPGGDLSKISNLLGSSAGMNSGIVASAAKLAGAWKLTSLTPALANLVRNTTVPETVRQSAIEGLRDLGGAQATSALRELTNDKEESIRRSAAAALATTDLNGSMAQIISVLAKTTREEHALALWRALLSGKAASPAFARTIARTNLPEIVARAGVRVSREGGRTEPDLVLALNKAGGLTDTTAALTDEEIHHIAYDVTRGDPANGERLFRRKDIGCTLCHSIGGAGGKVGPDLTSLGASTPVADYIVESVLLPNKKVKEGFNSVQITTSDDEEIAGNLVREDNEQVILRDATNKEISIPKRKIKERKMGGSLMPAGIVEILSPKERLDLYAFLSQLGKPGAYDATKQNVARVWHLNPKVGTVNADQMLKSDLHGKEWTPLYATVAGNVPSTDIVAELPDANTTFWVATRFQIPKAGPARFTINGTTSPKAWIDGKAIGGDKDLTVDLPPGAHTLFLKITATDLNGSLRVESNEATFMTE